MRRDQPDQAHLRPRRHAHHLRLPPSLGERRLPPQRLPAFLEPGGSGAGRPQPRQLGGLALGRHAHVGIQPPPGHPRAVRPARRRAQAHRDDRVLVGRPREHGRRHLLGLREHGPPLLAQGTGREDGLHRPLLQPHRRPHRRQVVLAPAGHRRRSRSGHRLHLADRRHLRQGVHRRQDGRLRRVEGLRPGRVRRRAQDAGVGRRREPHPGARHPGAGPGVGRQEDHAGLRVAWAAGAAPAVRPPATSGPGP